MKRTSLWEIRERVRVTRIVVLEREGRIVMPVVDGVVLMNSWW